MPVLRSAALALAAAPALAADATLKPSAPAQRAADEMKRVAGARR